MRLVLAAIFVLLSGCAVSHRAVPVNDFGSGIVDGTLPTPGMSEVCTQGRRDLCPSVAFRSVSPGPFLPAP